MTEREGERERKRAHPCVHTVMCDQYVAGMHA